MSPEVLSAIIQTSVFTFAALAPAIAGAILYSRRKLELRLAAALGDIRFLLAVEELHCREHRERDGATLKMTIRNLVRIERGLEWSGINTPGRTAKLAAKLNRPAPAMAVRVSVEP